MKKNATAAAPAPATTETATTEEKQIFVFIAIHPNFWAKGKTPQNAIFGLTKYAGKKPDIKTVSLYMIQCKESQYDEVFVSEYAEICYPSGATKTYFKYEK